MFCNLYIYQITTWYTLNLHTVVCHIYFNKAGEKKSPLWNIQLWLSEYLEARIAESWYLHAKKG